MRYAIVSDIHANLAAWKTVLKDIADMRADKIICLGDVSGYGPQPVDVLESVYRVVNVTLLGNHDAAICGKLDPNTFSPRAKTAVLRHREQLSGVGMAWLKTLPLECV
ncbi:MAG: metallophosphoesterase, partial [bacterium]